MNQPLHQIPGLGQRRLTPDAVDIIPGLSLLSRRGEAPTDFMDQHSQQIPGLGRDFQNVGVPAMADVIPGLSNFSRRESIQPLQQPSLGVNSDIDTADIIPGLSLLSRKEKDLKDQRSQQVPGLHQYRGEMALRRKIVKVMAPLSQTGPPILLAASQANPSRCGSSKAVIVIWHLLLGFNWVHDRHLQKFSELDNLSQPKLKCLVLHPLKSMLLILQVAVDNYKEDFMTKAGRDAESAEEKVSLGNGAKMGQQRRQSQQRGPGKGSHGPGP
ncbi:hypothetical protein B0H14DRAFT_2587991 [Mycena olivaceomarginata]|nr:hypothetical protein B0H14DRAFT_2587991 [Mycena olivaceomarginata]